MPKITLVCEVCGKEYQKYPSQIRSDRRFCSRACYLLDHGKNTKTCICEVCGREFKGSSQNANRFCSRACYDEWHNIKNKERECPVCHRRFIAKTSEDKYCSWDCYNKDRHAPKGEEHWNWQGGISKQNDRHDSTEYKAWRQAVYERDNYKCVKCGSKEKLNAHHILLWKYHPELRYDISNGVTLCEKCHVALHQKFGYDTPNPVI